MILLVLFGGCTSKHKTKEQLVNEGIKLVQEKNPRGAINLFKNALEKDQNYFEARFQLAKAQHAVGNFGAAEKELQKVRRQNPSSRDVQLEIARVMASLNRPDEALKELSAYLGDNAADCDALEIAGLAHAMKEDYPVAISLLKKAVASCDANITSATLSLANVHVAMGEIPEAETELTRVLTREPKNRRALFILVDIQTNRKDTAAALKMLDRILKTEPRDIEAWYRKGLLFVESNAIDNALALSHEVINMFPERPEGHRIQGFAYFFKEQYRDAVAPLQNSLLLQPSAGTYYILGLTHYYRNESEQATNQFQKALDLQPSLARARAHLALLLLNKKRVDDAIQEAKTAVAQDAENAFAHTILGSAYLSKGNYAEGIAELNRALALDPSLADVHVKKGLAAMKRGMDREAESGLVDAVRLKSEAQDTRRILALYYINHNEPAKAIEVLKQSIQGGREDALMFYLMAESYLQLNNVNAAWTNYSKAKEADPKFDLAYFKLASLSFMQGKQEDGVHEIRSLLEHSPDNVPALLLLASLAEVNRNEDEARTSYLRAAGTKKSEGVIAAARYFQRTNDSDKALKILNDAISASPADIGLHEVKGQILLANKKYKDALNVFEIIERKNQQLGFGYLVNTYLAMGAPDKALEKVRVEIRENPTNLSLRAELSRIYYRMDKRTKAMENALEIILKNPESAIGYVALALIHQNSNEIDMAIETLRSAPKGGSAAVTFMLGNLYFNKKDYPAALEQYRKIENSKTGAEQVLFQIALILHGTGKKKDAEAHYQKVLRMSPGYVMALNNLAYLYAEENKGLPQALMYAIRAFMLAPQNDSVRDTLGYVLLKNNRIDEGLRMLKKASESSPNNPGILYHLALAYKERGDAANAMESLQKALALGDFPEARDATLLLEKIKKKGKS